MVFNGKSLIFTGSILFLFQLANFLSIESISPELERAQVLSAISSTISDTAVDIFVYDTRKDSDGGAWRHRCQDKSWENEPLGSKYRGSRRKL